MKNTCWLFLTSLLALAGCSDDREITDLPVEDPAEHACEQVSDDGQAVEATADQADAPVLSVSAAPYAVTLPESGAARAGFVKLRGPADLLLFTDTEAVVTSFLAPGSDTNELPEPAPNEFCADALPEHFDLDLEESGDYVVALGPTSAESVWLMVLDAADHGH